MKRKVTLAVTFTIEWEYPADWDDEQVEFHCNESSSCANNLIREHFRQLEEQGECACWVTRARVVPDRGTN